MSSTNHLARIAARMRAYCAAHPRGHTLQPLPGGLHLLLARDGDQYRLAIARTDTAPSSTEARTVAAAFGLPAGLDWSWTFSRKPGRPRFFVAELTWKETHPNATLQPQHTPPGPSPAGPAPHPHHENSAAPLQRIEKSNR